MSETKVEHVPLEHGFYWVRVSWPVCDGGGITHDETGAPEVARYENLRWQLTGISGELADGVGIAILSGPISSVEEIEKERAMAKGVISSLVRERDALELTAVSNQRDNVALVTELARLKGERTGSPP